MILKAKQMKQYKITFENINTGDITYRKVWLNEVQLKNIFDAIESKEVVSRNNVRVYIIKYIEPIEIIFKGIEL